MIFGASDSVLLQARLIDGREFGLELDDLAASVDSRLDLRCLVPFPGMRRDRAGEVDFESLGAAETLGELKRQIQFLEDAGWSVRITPDAPLGSALIVDDSEAIYYSYLDRPAGPFATSEPAEVMHHRDQFDVQWAQALLPEDAHELYERTAAFGTAESTKRIVVASEGSWQRVIEALARSPEELRGLAPRRFEELVAELLSRDGLDVRLTPATRDGGRDILAFGSTPVGNHLYLVECKRHAPTNPVGIGVVRQLYGVVTQERATAGLIVATSRFSTDAHEFAVSVRHQMSLRDYDALCEWLQRHARA